MRGIWGCARLLPPKSFVLWSFFPFKVHDHDIPKDPDSRNAFFMDSTKTETAKDRLYMMYSVDEFGSPSKEIQAAYQAAFFGGFTGVCFGGFVHSRAAYMQFIEQNQASIFENHYDAKKKLQDRVTVNFAKGAFRWGWRLALFCGSWCLLQTTISVYLGKSSIWEYLISGGIVGTCFRMNLGLRGMLVGGLLGSTLGTMAGGISLALLKLTGTTMEEVRFWQYNWKASRQQQQIKAAKKERMDEPLLIMHDAESGPDMKSLESIPDSEAAK